MDISTLVCCPICGKKSACEVDGSPFVKIDKHLYGFNREKVRIFNCDCGVTIFCNLPAKNEEDKNANAKS